MTIRWKLLDWLAAATWSSCRRRTGYHVGVWILRVKAVAGKEFWALFRQPQLLLLLLIGPVLIMVAFALSFQVENVKPRAVVVVEPGSGGAQLFDRFKRRFTVRTRFQGTMSSVKKADRMLENGETDAVIVIPPNPSKTVLQGKQAVLEVHYDNINPIFGTTVPNRSNGLILDLNESIVREGVSRQLQDAETARQAVSDLNRQIERVNQAAKDLASPEAQDTTAALDSTLKDLQDSLELLKLADSGDGGNNVSQALEQTKKTRKLLDEFRKAQREGGQAIKKQTGVSELEKQLSLLEQTVSEVPSGVSARVLVNPFRLKLENLAPFTPAAVGFYAPATLALLIQHIAFSLASLAIVRERLSGAYEFFEVSPLGPGELLAGKFLTYAGLVFGVNLAVAGALAGALQIPIRGGLVKLGVVMMLLTLASLAAGFLVSTLSRSRLQAIQIAMLAFIASGFFAGFLFPLQELRQPAQSISYFLPATYGIRALQDVMIRGQWPAATDLVGFAVIFVISLVAARLLMGRKKT